MGRKGAAKDTTGLFLQVRLTSCCSCPRQSPVGRAPRLGALEGTAASPAPGPLAAECSSCPDTWEGTVSGRGCSGLCEGCHLRAQSVLSLSRGHFSWMRLSPGWLAVFAYLVFTPGRQNAPEAGTMGTPIDKSLAAEEFQASY